jgi:potassium efflux system protein
MLVAITLAIGGVLWCAYAAPGQAQPVGAPATQTAEPNDPNAATPAADPNAPQPAAAEKEDPNAAESALVPAGAATAPKVTIETLQAQRKQFAESADLSDEVKGKLTDIYDKAIAQLKLASELAAKDKQYEEALKTAPGQLEKVKQSLEQPAPPAATLPADAPLAQAEQALTEAQLALEEAKTRATNLEDEPKRRADRRTKIPEETSAARQRLEEIKTQLAAAPEEDSAVSQANRTLLQLERRVLENRIEANKDELLLYDATGDLLAAQRDLAARGLAAAQKRVETLQQTVSDLRQQAAKTAKEQAARAERETQYKHRAIQGVAKENAELAQQQAELVAEIEQVSQYAGRIGEQLAALGEDLTEIQQQVEQAGGVTDVLGVRLMGERSKLPDIGENRRRIRQRPTKINEAQLKWIDYDTEWSDLSDIEERADTLLGEAAPPVGEAQRETIRKDLVEQLQTRRKTLEALSDLYLDYSTRLANLDTQERELVAVAEEFEKFINAHILWVKSRHTVRPSDAADVVAALGWLVSPTNWRATAGAVWTDFKRNPAPCLALAFVMAASLVFRGRIHRRLEAVAEHVRQVATDSFLQTLQALALTLALAATWPVLLLLACWCFASAAPLDSFSGAVAFGLLHLAYIVFVLSFLKHLLAKHGLTDAHFRLREETRVFLRRHLRWFTVLAVPLAFLTEVTWAQQFPDEWSGTAGRVFFLAFLFALTALLAILLRPTSPMLESYLRRHHGGWLERLRYLWYPLCLLLPLGVAAVAGIGYFYGARYLTEKLLDTIVLVLFVLLLRALFIRWLVVVQRRLAVLERQKRQAAAAEQKSQEAGDPGKAKASEAAETKQKPEQTIFQMSQQTRQLINALGEHTLWTTAQEEAITLGAVTTAVVVFILMIVAARNAPGLLEIIILRRLPIDRGARFAIITICRYIVVVVGVVIAFGEIGIGWSKVQWLIAAMTVGLGFGLQEIFANFISGLIILFEQPIRVDDVVTVGDVTGHVTKIRTRATTIRQWDQREFIVPNKEFITGRLVNWTLSDSLLRRDFPVGIAYGSDIRKAEKILYEIAAANTMILDDPKPMVIFKGFGDSTLDFELRVYITGIEKIIPVWHEINCAIDDAFRKADIEIAFPQRDLHLRTADPELQSLFKNTNS